MALIHSTRFVTDGLVLYLDAANTKSYSGSGTTWTDLTGKGNDGTLINGVSHVPNTNFGYFDFDGTNDRVDFSTYVQPAYTSSTSFCTKNDVQMFKSHENLFFGTKGLINFQNIEVFD